MALLDSGDDLHHKANHIAEVLETQSDLKIYTTDLVLAEFLHSKAIYANPHIRIAGAELVIEIRASQTVEVLALTGELFGAALLKYKAYQDKAWSITDCLSFVVMEQYQLTDALAYDHHFLQAGYRPLLRMD